ncbi:acyl-CoA dehydrogenase/oxidase [Aspergillus recurvatus]
MNFEYPPELVAHLDSLDSFIHSTILPLQHQDDNNRFFDHRREYARTNWENGGLPRKDWEDLLNKARTLADSAGLYRFALPKVYGGASHPRTNLYMSAIRFHLSSHSIYGGGLGLANDLQNEHSIVGNFPDLFMLHHFGTEEQKRTLIPARLRGEFRTTFGLTEPDHGSDATFMSTIAQRKRDSSGVEGWEINGAKKWQTGAHHCTHMILFARTSGKSGSARGITAFLVPAKTEGIEIASFEWTFNMPTDHATVTLNNVFVPDSAILGKLDNGLAIAQTFVHENRIRQAASSCGAAKYCLDKAIERANSRTIWGEERKLSEHQGIQFPVVELMAQVEMLRLLILRTSVRMDDIVSECEKMGGKDVPWVRIERELSGEVAMCNYWANRLACQAADRAIQIHGGDGYSRHYPFEHIYRHFRRYRITEGSEEIQMRKVAAYLFGVKGKSRKNGQEQEKEKGKL